MNCLVSKIIESKYVFEAIIDLKGTHNCKWLNCRDIKIKKVSKCFYCKKKVRMEKVFLKFKSWLEKKSLPNLRIQWEVNNKSI